jgi:hypothetical protein
VFTLPAGVGSNLYANVTNQWQRVPTSLGGSFSYNPPSVTSIFPTSATTNGSIPLTLTGTSLGRKLGCCLFSARLCLLTLPCNQIGNGWRSQLPDHFPERHLGCVYFACWFGYQQTSYPHRGYTSVRFRVFQLRCSTHQLDHIRCWSGGWWSDYFDGHQFWGAFICSFCHN